MRWIAVMVIVVLAGCTQGSHQAATPTTTATAAPPTSQPAATTQVNIPPTTIAPTTASPKPADPAAVVRRFYAAINDHDYSAAWTLGGNHLGTRSYQTFAAGYADTDHDQLRITAVRGQLVDVRLVASQDGGTRQTTYAGTYRVAGGAIASGRLHVLNQAGSGSPGACDPAYPDFCIPPPPPDLDCRDIGIHNFTVRAPDPHHFDADHDGIGCER
jgi:hypothetical protein